MMRYYVRMIVSVMVLVCSAISAHALDKSYYAESSKLASGKWVKVSVTESGIYQITADDIRNWGLGSDLSQIHVFGYGGAPLSETMLGDNYADDLPQMPVVRSEGRILFYAQGPLTWTDFRNGALAYLQVQHPYAISGSYFVTNDSRFSDIDIPKAQNTPTGTPVTTYIERLYHEQEICNPGETGRVFLGESFVGNRTQTFKFNLDGIVSGSLVKLYTVFAAQTVGSTSSIALSCNGNALPVLDTDIIGVNTSLQHDHYRITKPYIRTLTLDGTEELNLTLTFSCSGTVNLARLDFITLNYERVLALRNGSLTFGLPDASVSSSYRLSNCGGTTRVWDVTRPFAPVQMNVSAGEGTVTFTPDNGGRREFVAFEESDRYPHPDFLSEVANQDIHSEPVPDMIILSPSAYLDQAKRVAELHEKCDNFSVLVLDHEKVFNEFSSGTHDAMAYRRLCKMFYDRSGDETGKLGYLLLMGCGSYDNRLVGTDAEVLNYPHLLTWQSDVSNDENTSYTTDDYFGVLADGSSSSSSENLSIAVGRMIVKSSSEARTMVNKLVKYVTKPDYGAWKNQALMVADDENWAIHMIQDTTIIANARKNGASDIVFNRVYIDAFNAVSEGGSRSYPDARAKLFNTLNEGALWWNYIGHASTQNWTGEGLLMRSDVESSLFYRHLPVLYAATCEYTRYDNSVLSSGERIYLNGNGGAIAVICPARLAFIVENGKLSAQMGNYIFARDESGKPQRIGDIVRQAKNATQDVTGNKLRFFVFGDPAMRLAWAPYRAEVETINGKPVNKDQMPVFKAREQVEFGGHIVDWKGDPVTGFDGSIVSTLFDAEQSITTHGYGKEGAKLTYEDRSNRLAISVDTVTEGRFTVRLVIPSEVNNEYDNFRPALINLYAYDRRDSLEAKGANSSFYIYGYEDELVTDTIGPDIIVMDLNDSHFTDGCEVNESPLLLATISDDSGVNFSSAGIGHNMVLTLDGTVSFNDLVSFYTPVYAEQGTLGSITYQLNDLAPGPHTLRLRVWDVYNNVGDKTINFNVVKGLAPEIADVYCAANPASVETSFYVKHNRPDAVVTVTIDVFDLMGHRVWSATQSGRSDMYTSTPVTWDLTDMSGRRVPRGIYVYRATITTDGVKEATKGKKLAVTGD